MSNIFLEEKNTDKALEYLALGRDMFEDDQSLLNTEINLYIQLGRTSELIEKLAKSEDRHLRLAAEFDNYRRRKDKEVSQMLQYEGRGIFESLLPVVDDLDRLVDVFNEQDEDKNNSSITEGINLIQTKTKIFLEEWKLSSYWSPGDILDSDIHDAIMVKKEKGKKEDEVLQVFQKGYRYKDKVLRHAKVIVNKKWEISMTY